MSVASLFAALEAAGARLALTEDGEGLALTGKRPPADVLAAVRAAKPALLEALRSPAKEEAAPALAPASSSPDLGTGEGVRESHTLPDLAPWEDLPTPQAKPPKPGRLPDGRLDLAYFATQPGHCGSCARWKLAPDYGADMGGCACPPSAWPGNLPPLALHVAHRCAAYREEGQDFGRGYRSKTAGKRHGPRPLEDLGAA